MYKHGFLLGKFYPPTLGHIYLIEEASKCCEHLVVLIATMYDDEEPFIPGIERYKILKEHFSGHKNVIIKFHQGDEPQFPEEHERFWGIWLKIVLSYIDIEKTDVVFSSEEYGNTFARLLGITHECIDLDRKAVPISGTKVREDLYKNWEFLPQETKRYFMKKIAFMGPESTGKSTISEIIAKTHFKHLYAEWIPEYGRTFYETYGQESMKNQHSFQKILNTQTSLLKHTISHTNSRLIICDTEDITTKIFYDLYHPTNQILDLNKLEVEKIDYRIVFYPDNESTQDGTRENLHKREEHCQMIIDRLIKDKLPHIVLRGSYSEKIVQSIEVVNNILNL